MKKTFVILGVLLMTVAASAQQVAKGLTASNGEYVGFYEYKPTDYNTGTKYPVIIFLHGIGERGDGTTQLSRVLGNGTPNNIQNGHTMRFFWNGKWETFLVLTPQLNSKYGWWPTWYVDEMIKYAKANLSIDQNRIFLTGLSLGGGGVWSYAAGSLDNAKQLAAIGVTCGTCQNVNWGNIANANLPTWAWHASDDGTVPSSCSKGAVEAINALNPAVRAYVTIWPTGQHWIWGKVYNTDYEAQHPNIYEWFLGQNKSLPANKRPVANAGADITISTLSGNATLTGASSSDPDGNIVRYVWTKVSGPSFGTIASPVTTSASTTISGLTYPGTYVYELRVLDNRADWSVDQVTINVVSGSVPDPTGNKAPVAKAGSDVSMTLPNNSATLNGTGSSDPDGSISSFTWSKVAGPSQFTLNNGNSATASVSGLAQGTYTFRLTVKDNNNATNTDDVNITVNASGSTPGTKVANAGGDITIALPTNSTTLNGSGSTDPGGAIKQYEWTKVGGPSQYAIANNKSASTSITNLAQGVYLFKLTVWNHDWVPSSDTTIVTVNGSSSGGGGTPGKVANAGADISITLPTNTAQLNAYGSSDPGGTIKAYEWSKISGPSQFSIADAKKPITDISNLAQGTYTIKLTVWDHNWVPSSDEVVVTVNASGSGGGGVPGRIPNAGADIYLTLPTNSTTLDGSASKDPGGAIKQFEWTKISGPSQYNIASSKSATTGVSNLVEGLYKFKLTVWDHRWVPSNDTVDVIVKGSGGSTGNLWSNAGEDIYITLPVNSTTLNGYASKSPDGRPFKQYQWKKVSGPAQYTITNPNAQATTLTNLAQGNYSFELTVWNADWVPKSDVVNVYVMSGSAASSATLGTTEVLMSARTAGGAEATTVDKLTVYPNPAHGLINVQTISEEVGQTVINIYDVTGKNVQKVTFEKSESLQQRSLNVTRLAPGVYHLEVVINNKRKMVSKFIKQ